MHDNIYDVVFNDGKTIKCHVFYEEGNQSYALVDYITNLGTRVPDFIVNIDEVSKTITSEDQEFISSLLDTPNIGYNYFQNSNLSAWKVWYCLDNNKVKYAWADDSVDEGSPATLVRRDQLTDIYVRSSENDTIVNNTQYYAWVLDGSKIFTESDQPEWNDPTYTRSKGGMVNTSAGVESYTPAEEGTGLPKGRGVIYRLIDEWNNDCPYDFKNIQFYDEGNNLWPYAIRDADAPEEDPTLDGIRVKAIHLLSNYNNELGPIANGRLSRTALENVIFINNSSIANDVTNTIVRDGLSLFN